MVTWGVYGFYLDDNKLTYLRVGGYCSGHEGVGARCLGWLVWYDSKVSFGVYDMDLILMIVLSEW